MNNQVFASIRMAGWLRVAPGLLSRPTFPRQPRGLILYAPDDHAFHEHRAGADETRSWSKSRLISDGRPVVLYPHIADLGILESQMPETIRESQIPETIEIDP